MASQRILLDTHTLIWALTEPKRLGRRVHALIEDRQVERLVSAITAYELAQLARKSQLATATAIVANYDGHLERLQTRELALTGRVCLAAASFAQRHGDPFDRIIATQGIVEGIPVVTVDRQIAELGALTIW